MADRYRIEHGDCLDLLKREPANSWDAMVTDPPGGISFMSRGWDGDKGGRKKWVAFMAKRFKASLRVLKPGAHAFVWALPRTSHWTGCALEDAGFEIRDCPSHCFGSGFPKSHNLPGGLGTALKPAHELWFLVRKPLEGTVAQNYEKYGTGVLNIDACRVATSEDLNGGAYYGEERDRDDRSVSDKDAGTSLTRLRRGIGNYEQPEGRWPPNLLLTHDARCRRIGSHTVKATSPWAKPSHDNAAPSSFTGETVSPVVYGAEDVPVWECIDGCPVLLLDRQSGGAGGHGGGMRTTQPKYAGKFSGEPEPIAGGDAWGSGTASRFFPQFEWNADLDDLEPFIYAAKASRGERDKGLEHFKGNAAQRDTPNPGGIDAGSRNVHPTVKSVELIRYLTRLITPPRTDGRCTVGSIFMGSGTDGVAALLEGCDFVGFEQQDTDEEPFVSIARARCEHALGYTYVPRESLRTASPPAQTDLFATRETA